MAAEIERAIRANAGIVATALMGAGEEGEVVVGE